SDWRCVDWIVPCMPHRRGASGTALLPAALAYQVLALAGGEVEAGDAVAQAAKLVPTTLLELVAWLLEVARKGTSFEPPVLAPLPDPDDAEHEEPDADSDPGRTAADGGDRPVVRSSGASLPPRPQVLRQPRVPPVLRSLEQCDVAVHG